MRRYTKSMEKLQKIENIEEELGIDLVILLKCRYVFVKKGNKVVKKSVLINLMNNSLIYLTMPKPGH